MLRLGVNQHFEATVYHSLDVEGHLLPLLSHVPDTWVLLHFCIDAVAIRARLEHDPQEHHCFVRLELDRRLERNPKLPCGRPPGSRARRVPTCRTQSASGACLRATPSRSSGAGVRAHALEDHYATDGTRRGRMAIASRSGESLRMPRRRELRSVPAVDHPRDAESIDKHAKTGGPEGLLDRHCHRSVFRQGLKYAFCFSHVVDLDRY